MKVHKKKILVTGSRGQLGSALKDLVSDFPQFDFLFTTASELDISDKDQIDDYFLKNRTDYCINCAAYTKVDLAEKEKEQAFKINAEGVKNLALACKKNETILIHISTDYVFSGNKREPYSTKDLPAPINIYGESKLAGEMYIQEIMEKYYIVRTSWLYHKKYGKNFYKTIIEKAQKGATLKITDSQTGCPTNAENLSKFILQLIVDNKNFGIRHFCDGEVMTWYEFAVKILKENSLYNNSVISKQDYETIASRPVYSVLKMKD
ncbi:dTDP-4-dehydrorhamnose reductase [Flavobacteriaceae bacterium M23B6Z8]